MTNVAMVESIESQNGTKLIIFSSGQKVQMKYEEVREQFYPMMIKVMRRTNLQSDYNKVEEDDFMQILELELWKAFEQYDPDTGYCFSTYIFNKLRKGKRDATYSRYSQKNQHAGLVSLDAPLNAEGMQLSDVYEDEAASIDDLDFQALVTLIKGNLTEDEKEIFKMVVDVKNHSVQNYADKHNISRQGANQRLNKLKLKLRALINEQYLDIK